MNLDSALKILAAADLPASVLRAIQCVKDAATEAERGRCAGVVYAEADRAVDGRELKWAASKIESGE